ncbi:hypothetical protein [Microbacterium marinilacus]|uniref:Alkaline shock response membrane anchor protein AmaP n=1 Tax=Microbacterium marinilacus TaxID=415209 RepID=A0ABP7BMR1_9MICO|nr:hypothetical protein [Microbacterium marinilacus]MBY0690455.1 hypothetical protein [Microbacterium marinilacus]
MNGTNRVVNRIVLLVVGVVLLAGGAATVLAATWPVAGDVWSTATSSAVDGMIGADERTRLSDATTASGLVLAVLAVLLLIVVVAIVVIAKLGGGRTGTVIRAEAAEGAQGPVTIRHGFVSDAITHSLAGHDEILSSRVSARRVKGDDVLHISVTPRRNTSPVDVADTVTRLVDNLATLTGQATPTYVSIHSGVRARLAADQPRVN